MENFRNGSHEICVTMSQSINEIRKGLHFSDTFAITNSYLFLFEPMPAPSYWCPSVVIFIL